MKSGIFAVLALILEIAAFNVAAARAQQSIVCNSFPCQITVMQATASPTPSPSPSPSPSPMPPSPTASPTPGALPQTIAISSPADGSTVAAGTLIKDNDSASQCGGKAWFESCYLNGSHYLDQGFGLCPVTVSGAYSVHAHTANPGGMDCAQSNTINVTVSSPTPTGAPTPSPVATSTPGPVAGAVPLLSNTIPQLTGDPSAIAAAIPGVDTNPLDFGQYKSQGGAFQTTKGGNPYSVPVCCGPLLTDLQAAEVTMIAPETKMASSAGTADNQYFENQGVTNPSGYLAQVNAVNNAWGTGPMATVMKRVDGACPIQNPTTPEIIQWAANKWGFNPLYGYTEACDEGDWNNTSLGDNGTSSGVFQCADRGSNHGWSALVQANSMLPRENTCYNADFFFATRWAAFHVAKLGDTTGITGETPPNDAPDMVQSWFSGHSSGCPSGSNCSYQQMIYSDIASGWKNAGIANNGINPPCWYAGGHYFDAAIPYAPPSGTLPTGKRR